MDNTTMHNIRQSLDHIYKLVNHLDNISNKQNGRPDDTCIVRNINIKLNILDENLESIIDNITDIITDSNNGDSLLSKETRDLYKSRAQINSTCKELFPIIFNHILHKNINAQVDHVHHAHHADPPDLSYF